MPRQKSFFINSSSNYSIICKWIQRTLVCMRSAFTLPQKATAQPSSNTAQFKSKSCNVCRKLAHTQPHHAEETRILRTTNPFWYTSRSRFPSLWVIVKRRIRLNFEVASLTRSNSCLSSHKIRQTAQKCAHKLTVLQAAADGAAN